MVPRGGYLPNEHERLGGRHHATARHLLAEGGEPGLQVQLRTGDEGALAPHLEQAALDHERVDRLAHGHPRHAVSARRARVHWESAPRPASNPRSGPEDLA